LYLSFFLLFLRSQAETKNEKNNREIRLKRERRGESFEQFWKRTEKTEAKPQPTIRFDFVETFCLPTWPASPSALGVAINNFYNFTI
jgi:hypothetical protein